MRRPGDRDVVTAIGSIDVVFEKLTGIFAFWVKLLDSSK
jgi:hypothetical protein